MALARGRGPSVTTKGPNGANGTSSKKASVELSPVDRIREEIRRMSAVNRESPTIPKVKTGAHRLESIGALPSTINEKTRVYIVQGRDPVDATVSPDKLILRVCINLIRANVDDELIYGILVDERYEISKHVLAQEAVERYVLRQIRRGHEFAKDKHLLELNEKHAVIENHGGKCRVLEDPGNDEGADGHNEITLQAFDDFRNRYNNRKVMTGYDQKGHPVEKPLGTWWLDHAARRQYHSIAFSPGGDERAGVYNLWRGFAVKAVPGERHLRYLEHLKTNICSGDEKALSYLLCWMARAIQKPNAPGEVAIVLRGGKGTGKCLALGTKVLRYDGIRVNVEDICVGDELMGPDSRPRRVTGTSRGTGQLYRVVPVKGEPWICNDAHILTLESWKSGELIDIPVTDFISSSKKFKSINFQVHVGVDFSPSAPLPVDPYFLGLWFGDGTKGLSSLSITTMDHEILEACNTEAKRWGLHITKVAGNSSGRASTYLLGVKRGGRRKNPLLDALRKLVGRNLNLVPDTYLRASREDRLDFLAGWIDTDGHLSCGGFEITQKRRDYIEAVVFLGRSLGLQVTVSQKIVNGDVYWRAFISGDCSIIPTRLKRKRAPVRKHVKKVTRTGITIEDAGIGEYAGFEIDGDRRFLLGDCTVTHNTVFADVFGRLFGRHYWAVADAKYIVGNFNAHLRDCVILFGDEAFWAGDKKHESVLKALITGRTIVIESKGVDAETTSNNVHLIMASNSEWVVPASYDERRFLVLDVGKTRQGDKPYFDAIMRELEDGGFENLLYMLQNMDLSHFNHRDVPETDALQDQKLHSMEPHEEWWYGKLRDGHLRPAYPNWTSPIPKDALIDDYLSYAQRISASRRTNATRLARFLEKCCAPGPHAFSGEFRGKDLNGNQQNGSTLWWEFPPLAVCRAGFEKHIGSLPVDWPTIEVRESATTARLGSTQAPSLLS